MNRKNFSQLKQVLNTILLNANKDAVSNVHDDYVQNFVAICNYVTATTKSQLPVLLKPPVYWDEYESDLVAAKTKVLSWVETVMPLLQALPFSLVRDNDLVLNLFHDAIGKCDELIVDPSNKFCKEKLKEDIDDSLREMQDLILEISNVVSLLESFNATLPEQVKKLQDIVDLAQKDEKVDNAQIKELQDSIDDMKNEIKDLTAVIVGLAITDGVALTLSVVAIAVAGPFGLVACIFTGAAIAVATAYIAIDSMKIKSLKEKIEQRQRDMNDYTADVNTLVSTSKDFTALVQQATAIETNLRYILTVWQSLKGDLEGISAEMESTEVSYNSENWKAIRQDFQEATNLWSTFIEQVKVCEIPDISGNTCQLQPGMSSQEIDKAVKAGVNVSLIDYLSGKMAS